MREDVFFVWFFSVDKKTEKFVMWHVITNQDAQSNDDQILIAYFSQARYSVLNLKYQSVIKIIKQQESYIAIKVYEAL